MSDKRKQQFQMRFQKVLDYIDAHLDAELSLEQLSAQAAFSKFHFLRQFTLYYGVSVADYVFMMRMRRASQLLAYRQNQSILSIALASGFDSAEAFSRAFKRASGQTPTSFRAQPQWLTWHDKLQLIKEFTMRQVDQQLTVENIKLVKFPETKIAVMQHRGRPERLPQTIARFIAWRKANQLPPSISATYNLAYDDPHTVTDESFRFDLCAAIKRPVEPNSDGVIESVIPEGRCALLRYIGREEGFAAAIYFLFREWLPQSGEEVRDFPLFFHRVNFYPDVPENQATTDIYLPLI